MSLNTDRARGTLDRFRSMPIWQPSVVVGGLIGDMARYVLATCLVLGMGLASAALTAVFGPLTMRLYRAGQGGS